MSQSEFSYLSLHESLPIDLSFSADESPYGTLSRLVESLNFHVRKSNFSIIIIQIRNFYSKLTISIIHKDKIPSALAYYGVLSPG